MLDALAQAELHICVVLVVFFCPIEALHQVCPADELNALPLCIEREGWLTCNDDWWVPGSSNDAFLQDDRAVLNA
eukprot:10603274-Alexandrium_andersonii.AAC.1